MELVLQYGCRSAFVDLGVPHSDRSLSANGNDNLCTYSEAVDSIKRGRDDLNPD